MKYVWSFTVCVTRMLPFLFRASTSFEFKLLLLSWLPGRVLRRKQTSEKVIGAITCTSKETHQLFHKSIYSTYQIHITLSMWIKWSCKRTWKGLHIFQYIWRCFWCVLWCCQEGHGFGPFKQLVVQSEKSTSNLESARTRLSKCLAELTWFLMNDCSPDVPYRRMTIHSFRALHSWRQTFRDT